MRAIKVKLNIRNLGPQVRRALWYTHESVNEMVREYERLLLEMRQRDVLLCDRGGREYIRCADEWVSDLKSRLKNVPNDQLEEVLQAIQGLYDRMANSGDADSSRAIHSFICTKGSNAGLKAVEWYKKWEIIIPDPTDLKEDTRARAEEYARLEEAHVTGGRRGKWSGAYREGDSSWFELLVTELKKKKKEMNDPAGSPAINQVLRETGAVPFFKQLIPGKKLSEWERMALKLAASHIISWESLNVQTKENYDQLTDNLTELLTEGEEWVDQTHRLKEYEKSRSRNLEDNGAFWSEETIYRIRERELRQWRRLRSWLQRHPNATIDERQNKAKDIGSKGGAELLMWLALPENQDLSNHNENLVEWHAQCNRLRHKLAHAKSSNLFTFAEAIAHPRPSALELNQGKTRPSYSISVGDDGSMEAVLSLLDPENNESSLCNIPLCPTRQLFNPLMVDSKIIEVTSQDGLSRLPLTLRGANLIFDRQSLNDRQCHREGNIGDVYLTLSVEVPLDKDIYKARSQIKTVLQSSLLTRRKKSNSVKTGLRVMSVDLGQRSAAACAVFELVENTDPRASRSWPTIIPDSELCIHHERSFLLKLPGESPSEQDVQRRWKMRDENRHVSLLLSHLKNIRILADAENTEDRQKLLENLLENGVVEPKADDLQSRFHDDISSWRKLVSSTLYRPMETACGNAIHTWRKSHSQVKGVSGKSMWHIKYLEDVRKILMRWDRHTRPGESVKRFHRSRQGTIAKGLLHHINHLKKDRIQTTVDMIVQAARGIVRRGGKWNKVYPSVDVIILEDLSRYRFSSDRPRSENTKLMQWAHRSILEAVEGHAKEDGIAVAVTGAAFSSRYDAMHNSPGIRCHSLSQEDIRQIQEQGENHWLVKLTAKMSGVTLSSKDRTTLRPGSLLPTGNGEVFVSLLSDGSLKKSHADINAAQNIGIRAITGHGEPVRIKASEMDDGVLVAHLSKMLQGPLGGEVVSLHSVGPHIYKATSYATLKKLSKAFGDRDGLRYNNRMGKVLHRDPSGVFFPYLQWVESGRFWGEINRQITNRVLTDLFFLDNSPQKLVGD